MTRLYKPVSRRRNPRQLVELAALWADYPNPASPTPSEAPKALVLSENCIAALDIVNQWMETNYAAIILPHSRPKLSDPEANCLVCSASWTITSPPLHNNPEKMTSLIHELGTIQGRRENPLCSRDRSILKNVICRLESQRYIDKCNRYIYEKEGCLVTPHQLPEP